MCSMSGARAGSPSDSRPAHHDRISLRGPFWKGPSIGITSTRPCDLKWVEKLPSGEKRTYTQGVAMVWPEHGKGYRIPAEASVPEPLELQKDRGQFVSSCERWTAY